MNNILIIDGNQIAFKSFITLQNFSTYVDGEEVGTGVMFGFLKSLIKIDGHFRKRGTEFDKIIVTWDRGNKLRREIDPTYKQKREEDKSDSDIDYDEFINQVKLVEKYLPLVNVEQVYSWGNEADDVMKTLCEKYKGEADTRIIVASNDHDMQQLIDKNVWVYQDKKNGGVLDIDKFEEKIGIHPYRYTEVMTLTGCSTDEVDGIYRVGESTAIKLINKMDDIVDKILNDKKSEFKEEFDWTENKKNKILEYWDTVKNAHKLVQLYTIDEDDLEVIPASKNDTKMRTILNKFNMTTLMKPVNWRSLTELGMVTDRSTESNVEEDVGWDF